MSKQLKMFYTLFVLAVITAFFLGAISGVITCTPAEASYQQLKEHASAYAHLTAMDTTTITTGGSFYEIQGVFANRNMNQFTVVAGPPAGIQYHGETRWFLVEYDITVQGNSNGMNVEAGIAIDGTTPDSASIMGTFLKTANEPQAFGGSVEFEVDSGQVVTLVGSADDDGDLFIVKYLTTSIDPLGVR